MTATERRRNAYADHCYVCRKEVPAGEGWLYSDVRSDRSRSRYRSTGRFKKRVKCDRCHNEKISHKWQADNLDNPKPAEPVVRPWSVSQVKKWALERGEHEGDVALFVVGPFGRLKISDRDSISCSFVAPSCWQLEEFGIADKPLSQAAAKEFGERVRAEVTVVANAERASAESAAKILEEAGASVERGNSWHSFKVQIGGGRYWLWGKMAGNVVSGVDSQNNWIETTAEVLARQQAPEPNEPIDPADCREACGDCYEECGDCVCG